MLVVDASWVVDSCITDRDPGRAGDDLIAPPLMWSESFANVHRLVWLGALDPELARAARRRLDALTVRLDAPPDLQHHAWQLADAFGWAKTYDAEYVALAQLRGCRLLTKDEKLRRGADRLGFVIGPEEL